MKFSEATVILNRVWAEFSRDDKKQFIVTCVRYFFSRSLVKPCPMLKGNECQVYSDRPLNCRLYGLWPEDTYKARAQRLATRLDLPLEQVPLNTQCPLVRRNNGQPLTNEMIDAMDAAINHLDTALIMEGDKRRATEAQAKVDKNWNYRSLHDWALYRVFGEGLLVRLTQLMLHGTPESIRAQLETFETLVNGMEL